MTKGVDVRGVVWLGALAVGLAGCSGGEPQAVETSARTASTSPTSASPGTIGMMARCPTRLSATGLPKDVERWQAKRHDGHLVGETPPERVMLCRYDEDGRAFRRVGDKELPSVDRQAIVDDLRSVSVRADEVTRCMRLPEPTPFVLVLAMPNDDVRMVRADADPTCAYAGAQTTNGADDYEPIGNDLLETWQKGRWAGVTR